MLLMSATPFEPIYQSMVDAGLKLEHRIEKPLRKARRFLLHGALPIRNYSNTPDETIIFTTAVPG